GGRPDLAGSALDSVRCPTRLIVGGNDQQVLRDNEQAARRLHAAHDLRVVPGASPPLEAQGALEPAAELARDWFAPPLTAQPQHDGGARRGRAPVQDSGNPAPPLCAVGFPVSFPAEDWPSGRRRTIGNRVRASPSAGSNPASSATRPAGEVTSPAGFLRVVCAALFAAPHRVRRP